MLSVSNSRFNGLESKAKFLVEKINKGYIYFIKTVAGVKFIHVRALHPVGTHHDKENANKIVLEFAEGFRFWLRGLRTSLTLKFKSGRYQKKASKKDLSIGKLKKK